MGAVALGMVGFFVFLILRISQPDMVPLYTDLTFEDSSEIVRSLEATNVPYKLRQDGAVILVPQKQVLRLRMDLAESGLPSGGGVGYEIFDDSSSFGTTRFVQGINHIRALEGELARTIRTINRVSAARVHLAIPERELFQRDQREPSASIVVRTRGSLDASEIRAIRHLVASAVEGLPPMRVSVIDEMGQLLADGTGDPSTALPTELEERRIALERALTEKVRTIVGSVVGDDRLRVKVTAELDTNRITETQDLFDPEGRVVRSTQTREQTASTSETLEDQGVTAGNELPNAGDPEEAEAAIRESDAETEEIINYEISRTTRTETVEAGRLRRLSVAVVVDGIYAQDDAGNINYEPRTQEELDQIAALVRSTIGFDEARGDRVEIANLRFAEPPEALPVAEAAGFFSFTLDDYFRIAEIVVLLLLGLFAILFVIRPLVRRILTPDPSLVPAEVPALPGGVEGAGGGDADATAVAGPDSPLQIEAQTGAEMIEMAQIAGEVQAQSLERVAEIVKANPEEAISIVRHWLQEPAKA